MKNLWKPLVVGMLLLGASHSAQADDTAPGSYSDRQLTPTTQPPYPTAPVGNDLLLAENVGDGSPASGYYPAISPTSWQTAFFAGQPDGRGGFANGPNGLTTAGDMTAKSGFSFTGTGPTGVYPNAGAGKHTQDTKALLTKSGMITTPGHTWAYQYVVTYNTFNHYTNQGTPHTASLGINTYSF